MKKILVPCDFSRPAVNAFRTALDLAGSAKGTIELIHVIELPILNDSVLMPVLNFEKTLFKELKEKTQDKFKSLLAKHKTGKVRVNTQIHFGTPAMVIPRVAKKSRVDLIVMGSHGASGFREVFIGSNAEKIVRLSPAPVLVIKNYSKSKIKNVVFPNTPETIEHEDLVNRVKTLQGFFKANLHIVRVITPTTFATDTATRNDLNAFAKKHKLKNYTLNIFNELNPEQGILSFNELIKGDLIAMGTHGRKGLAHLFNGSNAEDVVNHADTPIWTYNLQKA